jgi:hypothetical protein
MMSAANSVLPDNTSPEREPSPGREPDAVMKSRLMAAPVVASYSPTVPVPATYRVLPDNANSLSPLSPVMKFALIVAPVVAS